tara:strand:+ start:413 stop:892 length:480 start_codon:yes stop_codon:yes gene_type:complete
MLLPVNYCHRLGIAHRDLKPENFIFETKNADSNIKVIDFGMSKIMNLEKSGNDNLTSCKLQKLCPKSRTHTICGTPYYMSPEVLSGNYGIECDMWSLGCLLYCLLCGYPPFYGDDNDQILKMVLDGNFVYDDEEWENVSKSAKNLVNQLICKPEKRLSA